MYTKVYFEGQTIEGAYIRTFIMMNEDYTMNQLVSAIKTRGFINFMTSTMNILVTIK